MEVERLCQDVPWPGRHDANSCPLAGTVEKIDDGVSVLVNSVSWSRPISK